MAFQLLARAGAGIGQAGAEELLYQLVVGGMALALPDHFAVPLEAVAFQRAEDRRLGAFDLARRVQVFHAHQPATADSSGIEIRGEGGDQRTEMQIAAGRGGKAPDIGRGSHWRRGL
ncbi:hypothetical protein D3C72_1771820 [compost metagenome]